MRIIYVGPFAYHSANANALRVKGVAQALALAGHEVHVCGGSPFVRPTKGGAPEGPILAYHVDEYAHGFLSRIHAGLRGLFLGNLTLEWIQSLSFRPDAVVLYGTHLGYLYRLLSFCNRCEIPLILDVVEWYDPKHLPGGVLGPFALANELSLRLFASRAHGIIAISTYLAEYFSRKTCRTLVLPPLFSAACSDEVGFRRGDGRLHICYAGSPGGKDDMRSVYHGLEAAARHDLRVCMHVVGITREEFVKSVGGRVCESILEEVFTFYGRVDNKCAARIVRKSDFQVLIRKDSRTARAGFPSKVAESLCLGTPVMCNLTSDLASYLVDGKNALLILSPSGGDFYSVIERAASLSEGELLAMRKHALGSAEKNFRPEAHAARLSAFIEERL